MIVCPNCNHQNPDGAIQCEACYTPLPATMNCPNCGTTVQVDASFCGQCGFNLRAAGISMANSGASSSSGMSSPMSDLPDLIPPDPLVAPEPLVNEPSLENPVLPSQPPPIPLTSEPVEAAKSVQASPAAGGTSTRLQQQVVRLLHVQTSTSIELPQNLSVIHLGKPNDRIPPDIDVSGFPDSEIVSRIHADIRIEGDAFYIEDVGSSNGTYINNSPLPMGNRHRLRSGDRIALGKGDKVTFLFQLS
ncbi:FHA domain-containing protein [Leptothermofonsia sichuanensis E412]|uniref:FHA domain-containing protein n=1 Tax=Leptothermofonsia sichuanensis TaxID=2917832 RepID=UPI001CA7B27E|nr:FHA domain-containing protein [Leptothermofonsia sichuanensis]QZZ22991.1 FHA domain-containing protein [Leptothermofonsia sichuanensis E412]